MTAYPRHIHDAPGKGLAVSLERDRDNLSAREGGSVVPDELRAAREGIGVG